jgi:hypothetical protein
LAINRNVTYIRSLSEERARRAPNSLSIVIKLFCSYKYIFTIYANNFVSRNRKET